MGVRAINIILYTCPTQVVPRMWRQVDASGTPGELDWGSGFIPASPGGTCGFCLDTILTGVSPFRMDALTGRHY